MCVVCGCTFMSYVACQLCSTGTTPQSLPNLASALFIAPRSCATADKSMFYLPSPGLSLPKAGPAFEPTCSGQSSQGRLYSQAAYCAGPATPSLCRSYSAHVKRDRQSRFDCDARSRSKAWLNRGPCQRRARFMWNMSSIDCLLPNSPKSTNCWYPTSGGPHANFRRQ